MEIYQGFFTGNLVFDLAAVAWLCAQLIKVGLEFIIHGRSSLETMFGTGGMPSSHSAFVMAIAVSIGVLYGRKSPLFALAAAFALVVMYDAYNVRHEAGKHAKTLNEMMEQLKDLSTRPDEVLKESLGHTPLQVIAGALLGSAVGGLAWFFK